MRRSRKSRYLISRRKKNVAIAMFFFFALVGLILDRHYGGRIGSTVKTVLTAPAASDMDGRQCLVSDVVDGDTIDLDAGQLGTIRIRLIGVDTPETKNPKTPVMYFGPQASDYTKRLCMGKQVRVETDRITGSKDRYGRTLAYIWIGDTLLNEKLIAEGFGYADVRFKHTRYDRFLAAQQKAIDAKRGLWKGVTRSQFPQWLQRENPTLYAQTP